MYNYMTVLTPMYMFDRGPGGGEKGNLRPPCAPFTRRYTEVGTRPDGTHADRKTHQLRLTHTRG